MTCESVREQLTAYLDGELADERGSAVRGHLRGCEACRKAATDEAALRDGLRALPPLDPPASLWAGVQAQLAAAEVEDAKRPAWRRLLARWAPHGRHIGFAGLALAAAVVLIVMRMQRHDETQPQVAQPVTPPQQTRVVIAPDHPSQAPAPAPVDETDVTAALAAEPAQITASYADTARELLDLAKDARAQWPAERQRELDTQVAALQKKIASATDERARQSSYRKLIRYLQRAVIRDDVALANIGGTP